MEILLFLDILKRVIPLHHLQYLGWSQSLRVEWRYKGGLATNITLVGSSSNRKEPDNES